MKKLLLDGKKINLVTMVTKRIPLSVYRFLRNADPDYKPLEVLVNMERSCLEMYLIGYPVSEKTLRETEIIVNWFDKNIHRITAVNVKA